MLYSYNADFGYTYYMRTYYIIGFNTDPMTNPVYQQWKEMTPIEGGGDSEFKDYKTLSGVDLNTYDYETGVYTIENDCTNLPYNTGTERILVHFGATYKNKQGSEFGKYVQQIYTCKSGGKTKSFVRNGWLWQTIKQYSPWAEITTSTEPTKVYVSFGDGSQDPEDGIGIYSQPDRQGTRYTGETLHNLLVAEKNNVIVVDDYEGIIYRLTNDSYDTWFTIYFSTTVDSRIISLSIEGDSVASYAGDLNNYYTKSEIDSKIGNKQDTLISGTNIKTINGNDILGEGNIEIQGGGGSNVWTGTEEEYNALETIDPETIYIIMNNA